MPSRTTTGLQVVLLLLVAAGCSLTDGDGSEGSEENFYFEATRVESDGTTETWSGKPYTTLRDYGTYDPLWVSGESQRSGYTGVLTFGMAYRGPGEYTLVPHVRPSPARDYTMKAQYLRRSGDIILSAYVSTDDSSANWLRVTRHDSAAAVVEGTFRTTVAATAVDQRDRESGNLPPADTLRFIEGRFRAPITDFRPESRSHTGD